MYEILDSYIYVHVQQGTKGCNVEDIASGI